MPQNSSENIYLFLTGDALAMIVSYALLKEVGTATLIAVATGFFGGAAAIAGKMLFTWIVNKIKSKKQK